MFSGAVIIITIVGIAYDFVVVPHGTKEPWFTNYDARIEKLYADAGKIVDTPMMNPDAATMACPKGYEVRREGKEDRGAQQWIVWELRFR